MYTFFRMTAKLEASHLENPFSVLEFTGIELRERKTWSWGVIVERVVGEEITAKKTEHENGTKERTKVHEKELNHRGSETTENGGLGLRVMLSAAKHLAVTCG